MTPMLLTVVSLALLSAEPLEAQADSQPHAEPAPVEAPAPGATPADPPAAEAPKAPDGKLEALAAEVRRLKEEIGLGPVSYEGYAGMGPAASKVYFTPKGLSIGGYGEAFYTHRPAFGAKSETDLLRMVLYFGYRFNERIVFNSELEFEHALTSKKGEVGIEFAYLDFKLHDLLTVRVGNLLMPMGMINEVHEPPFFFGVQRPEVERNLLPSTWRENGLGVYGQWSGLRYKAYLVNGLQGISEQKCVVDDKNTVEKTDDIKLCDAGNTGFSSSSWARNARQSGSKAIAENLAGVVSLDYERDFYRLGVSGYFGRSGQGQQVGGEVVKGEVLLTEAHASVKLRGVSVRGLFAFGRLGDSDRISTRQGQVIGSQVMGGYGEAAYDVMTLLSPGSEMELSPFVRFEGFNLHHGVAAGLTRDPANNVRSLTAGASFRPISTVVLKADVQQRWVVAGATATTVNLGMGFVF